MTAPLSHQAAPAKDTAAARKRRRRAPAGGAADDCFTCIKRNVKCDRRRPYCSQCLEVSNECSGYKTQLTWGVGVASRGKLRGLSLPIAKAPPVARESKKSPSQRARTNSNVTATSSTSSNNLQWADHHHHDESKRHIPPPLPLPRAPIDIPAVSQAAASAPTTPYSMAGYDYLSMSHPDNTPPPMTHGSWSSMGYSPGIVHSPDAGPKYSKFPLGLVTDGLSSSVGSVTSEVDYMSPMSQSYPRDELPFVHSPTLMYDSYSTHQNSPAPQSPPLVIDQCRAPTSCPSLVYAPSEPSSMHSHLDVFESQLNQKMMRECGGLSVPDVQAYNPSRSSTATVWSSQQQQHQGRDGDPSLSTQGHPHWSNEPPSITVSPELIARMPFFMDYYNSTVCPAMVYIDGPHNPFRDNILQLSNNSPSLQHAICALSACNLRMKRKLSLGHDVSELSAQLSAEKQTLESAGVDGHIDDQALSEEYQHRNLAVNLLNQQLNDPVKSTHDSVLATILLLCHYRMVESGIAKFHTQFAGVKKILSMRREQQFAPSTEPSWMEGLFTYFDAISASINDREAQLINPFSSSSDPHALPMGAENLVGCDRELFRAISKLGRLNMLAQHRLVQTPATTPGLNGDMPQSPFDMPLQTPTHRFDGNGFGSTLDDEHVMARSAGGYDFNQTAFWKEWKEVRLALQNWQFDASTMAANMPSSPSLTQVRELGNVSEAFRYAALLYTERLANPSLPPSHANFQNLVSQVVYYSTSLEAGSTAEKFMLWPLFVAGSECVNELQQNIVRTKCREMMTRSGYMNNLSALDVLEKLWATELKDADPRSPGQQFSPLSGRSPFNWAKCIGGAGFDMEWIMF